MKKNVKFMIAVVGLVIVSLTVLTLVNKRKSGLEGVSTSNLPRTKLFNMEEEEIVNKFELNYSNMSITVEQDEIGNWYITDPVQMLADPLESFANIKNFNTLIFDTIITNTTDMEVFGVDNPKEEYSIWEGDKLHTIYVGNQTLDEAGYYVKYEDEIFKLEDIYIMALRKSITDLRNKDFMKINNNAVVSIDINNQILLKKSQNDVITMNNEDNVDSLKVGVGFLLFSTLSAIDFTDDGVSSKDYGFNDNSRKIVLYLDDKSEITYFLSKVDVHIYAKLENDDKIYEVNPNIYTDSWYSKSYYQEAATEKEQVSLATVLNPTAFGVSEEDFDDFVPFNYQDDDDNSDYKEKE